MSPSTGVVFRCLYGLPLLALAAWLEWRSDGPMSRRTIGLSAVAGVFFAADLLTFHYVVDDIGAGLATIMGNLQVVVVAIAAWLLWGERPRREVMVALPVMLFGVVLISGVIGGIPYGANAQLGVAIGLITACSYAGYLLVIRRASPTARPAGPVAVATLVCMLAAGLFGALVGDLDLVPSLPAHAYLLAYGISSQSIGYLLIQVSLPRLPGGPDVGHPAGPAGDDGGPRDHPARRGAVAGAARGRRPRRGRPRARDRDDRAGPRQPPGRARVRRDARVGCRWARSLDRA